MFVVTPRVRGPTVSVEAGPLLFEGSEEVFGGEAPVAKLVRLFVGVFVQGPSFVFDCFRVVSMDTTKVVTVPPL